MPHAPGQLRCCLQVYFEMPQQASSGEAAAGRRRLQQARAKVVGGAVTGSTRDGQPLRTRQLFDRHGRLLRHCSTHRVRTSTLHEHTAAASGPVCWYATLRGNFALYTLHLVLPEVHGCMGRGQLSCGAN